MSLAPLILERNGDASSTLIPFGVDEAHLFDAHRAGDSHLIQVRCFLADRDAYHAAILSITELIGFARELDAAWLLDFPAGPDPSPEDAVCRIAEPHRALWLQCQALIAKATTPLRRPG